MDHPKIGDKQHDTLHDVTAKIEQLRVLAAAQPHAYLHELADCLGERGVEQARLQQPEAALISLGEAVELSRKLATEKPEMWPRLAMHLHNLGICQGLCQQPAAEFASMSESVIFLRQLAASQPDEYLVRFAMGVRELGEQAQNLGQQAAARFFTLEALDAYNKLADQDPQAFLLELAACLKALAIVMLEAGRREDALASYHMALERIHAVAQIDPSRVPTADIHQGRLMQERLQNPESTLAMVVSIVERARQRAQLGSATDLAELAYHLRNLGNLLAELGSAEEAVAAAAEAVQHYLTLEKSQPGAFLPNLAGSLDNLGARLNAVGKHDEAVTAAQMAVQHYRTLHERHALAFLPDIVRSVRNLGRWLHTTGQLVESLATFREAGQYCRTLVGYYPDAFLQDFAYSLESIALTHQQLGNLPDAVTAKQAAVEMHRKHAELNPDVALPDLANSLSDLEILRSALDRERLAQPEGQPEVPTTSKPAEEISEAAPAACPCGSGVPFAQCHGVEDSTD